MADSGRMTSYAEVMPVNPTCAWRIVISPMIPQDFPPCYYSSMRIRIRLELVTNDDDQSGSDGAEELDS
jgi:hypothetical protein